MNVRRTWPAARRLAVLMLLSFPAAAVTQSPAPRFPGEVEQVTVDVVVLDKDGEPVRGLKASDFTLYEDGKAQPAVSFEAIEAPETPPAAEPSALVRRRVSTNQGAPGPERSFVLVFDDVHLSTTQAEQAKKSVAEFLRNGLADGDRVQLVATGSGTSWAGQMPAVRADLLATLDRLKGLRPAPSGSDYIWDFEAQAIHVRRDQRIGTEVMRRWAENGVFQEYWSPGGANRELYADLREGHPILRAKAAQVYKDVINRQRVTSNALDRVLSALATSRGRKTVLLVTEGFIHDPQEGGFARVVEAARRANAVIYFMDARLAQGSESNAAELGRAIDIRDLGTTLSRQQQEATGAISVAADTGGERVGTAAALADNMRQVARLSRAYYLLGYEPANRNRDGRFRKIKVEVGRPGLEVRARKGYVLAKEDARVADPKDLEPEVQRALDSPFAARGIPLRLASYVLGPGAEGKARVVLVAEADIRALTFKEKAGRHHDLLEAFWVVTSRETGARQNHQGQLDLDLPTAVRAELEKTWLPLQRPFELAPGVHQVRLAVREKDGPALGTVTHEFEVEAPGPLRVSTPVITDAMVPGQAGGPPRPSVIARRTFAPGSRLFVQFEVWGAGQTPGAGKPQLSSGYTLRRVDGTVLSSGEPTAMGVSPQGVPGRILVLELPPTAAGGYELVLTVRDDTSGKTVELHEPLVVEGPAVPGAPAGGGGMSSSSGASR
jgi:VWFA-related protein